MSLQVQFLPITAGLDLVLNPICAYRAYQADHHKDSRGYHNPRDGDTERRQNNTHYRSRHRQCQQCQQYLDTQPLRIITGFDLLNYSLRHPGN